MKVSNLVDLRDVVVDSRGEIINDGDAVFFPGSYYSEWGYVVKASNGKLVAVCPKDTINERPKSANLYDTSRKNTVMFKIQNSSVQEVGNYIKSMRHSSYLYNLSGIEYRVETDWKERNNKKDTRGFPITDYFNRKIDIGDFIIYFDTKSKEYDYGIVLSNTQVLNESGQRVTVHFGFKIYNRVGNEDKIYKNIVSQYQELHKGRTADEVALVVGDLYSSGKNTYYIYLGKAGYIFDYVSETNISVDDAKLLSKNLWFKFPAKQSLSEVLNKDFDYLLKVTLMDNLKTAINKYFHSQFVYSTYETLIPLKCFTDGLSKSIKLHKVGHVDIIKEMYMESFTYTKYSGIKFCLMLQNK